MIFQLEKNKDAIEILRNYIENKLIAHGSPLYAYLVLNKKNPSENLAISSYPQEWVDIYRTNNFQYIDPVVLTAFRRSLPFSWDENITLTADKKLDKIFKHSKKYNISDGFTVVLHDHHNNLALLSLLINNDVKGNMANDMIKNQDALQMLLIDINAKMYVLGNTLIHKQKKTPTNNIFSSRENEIIYWASMGKTYSEIGIITGISPRTVKFHIANVKKKLNVLNARQAIRLCVELQLI